VTQSAITRTATMTVETVDAVEAVTTVVRTAAQLALS
jgi:hypothetical protein